MKVYELFESLIFEAGDVESIKRELQNVKYEMDSIKLRGGSLGHGGLLPQYIEQMKRLKARQAALREQLAIHKTHTTSKQELGTDWEKQQADKRIDPEAKAARNSAAISQGLDASHQLRKELGGYKGIADDIMKNIIRLTDNRTKPIEIETLANKYNVGLRTIHKWLERPEFLQIRRYMPHMYR